MKLCMLKNKGELFKKQIFYLLFYQTYQTTLVEGRATRAVTTRTSQR